MQLLTIIIPVYNEPELPELLAKLYSVDFKCDREILIVDDGSTDGTKEWLLTNRGAYDYRLILMETNSGKGAAVKEGIKAAKGNIMIIQDADLEYEPGEIPDVIHPIINGDTKVCYGSRYMNPGRQTDIVTWIKAHGLKNYFIYIGGRFINYLFNLICHSNLTDVSTCYKAFDIDFLKRFPVSANGFELEHELTIKIMKYTKISEIPIHYYPRGYDGGKKLNFFDGIKIFKTILKYRFAANFGFMNS